MIMENGPELSGFFMIFSTRNSDVPQLCNICYQRVDTGTLLEASILYMYVHFLDTYDIYIIW